MLKNITELLVDEKLESLWRHRECCKCEKCKEDIMAIALTRLPPHYVSSDSGELYAKTKMLSSTYEFQIMKELAFAMKVVEEHPRHKL